MNQTAELFDAEQPEAPARKVGRATFDPTDNKVRIHPFRRLDAETYKRVKDAGFKWAPKQEVFVAPMWTPQREDLAIELCGELEDEDATLADRAEERAERFEVYSDKREAEAHRAKDAVAAIADGIPLGQPLLIGHHSEKRARKDAERIQNGMRKAVKLWETSKYWIGRAARAKAHAEYKELPTVRARRIKTIEADKRAKERELARSERLISQWSEEPMTHERSLAIANQPECYAHYCFTLAKYPRNPPTSQYEGMMSLWSALDGGIVTAEQARDLTVPSLHRIIAWAKRWLIHYEMRLIYENAMLEESGYVAPVKEKSAKQTLPLCNYRAETISFPNQYRREEMITVEQIEMTKAQYAKVYKDYRGTRIVDGSHKVRIVVKGGQYSAVFLTDSKVHEKPAPATPVEPKLPQPRAPRAPRPRSEPVRTEFDDMRDTLKGGIKVVSAPQLFPTPRELAERMVELAGIANGARVLEPSAGTGAIVDAITAHCEAADRKHIELTMVEINGQLSDMLRARRQGIVVRGDFLELLAADLGGKFDVVVMNPPFANAADVAHILHALSLTKAGGRVVAICADGPRQNADLKPLAESWEPLPAGTFAVSGTNVRTVLAWFVVS